MRLFILIAIFNFFSVFGAAQNAQQLFRYAQELYRSGDYISSVSNLRRVIFFDDSTYQEAYKMLGDCYKNMGERDKSLYYYKLAKNTARSDSVLQEIQFDIVSVYLIFNEPNYALINLFAIKTGNSEYFFKKKELYTSFAYFLAHKFTLSKTYFKNTIDTSNKALVYRVDSLFNKAQKIEGSNIYLPMLLSIIPGLGQVYLGNYEAGINSLLLTSAFGGLYVYSIAHLGFVDALITFLPWFQRYYSGGMLQAKSMAIKKKERGLQLAYNQLVQMAIESSNLVPE